MALAGGNLRVLGIGAVANLCLVFGSLMFLRNTRYFHGEATAHRRAIQDAEVEGR